MKHKISRIQHVPTKDSELTGATSAVVWILHQQAASQGGGRVVQFSTVRLTEHQAKVPIAFVAHNRDPPTEEEKQRRAEELDGEEEF